MAYSSGVNFKGKPRKDGFYKYYNWCGKCEEVRDKIDGYYCQTCHIKVRTKPKHQYHTSKTRKELYTSKRY